MTISRRELLAGAGASATGLAAGLPALAATNPLAPADAALLAELGAIENAIAGARASLLAANVDRLPVRGVNLYEMRISLERAQLSLTTARLRAERQRQDVVARGF